MADQHAGAAHRRLSYSRDGFTPVSCLVADILRFDEDVTPESSKTDLSGQYGEPEVYTSWAHTGPRGTTTVVLHEHRWPSPHSGEPDPYRCEHYAAGETDRG